MGTLGPGSIGAFNLASSLAGTQQTTAQTGRAKKQASDTTFQIDQQTLAAHGLDDVAEADLSKDRDADGRLPYQRTGEEAMDGEQSLSAKKRRPLPDAFGERGKTLDLEA